MVKTKFISRKSKSKIKNKKDSLKYNKFLVLILMIILLLLLLIIFIFKNQIGSYIKIAGKAIFANEENCNEWSKCYFTYNLDDYNNFILDGEQNRTCIYNKEKTETKIETRSCFPKESITAKKTDDYIEVYDTEGRLVSKLKINKEDKEITRLDIEIIP